MSDLLKNIKQQLAKYDMEICACGGVHYVGKNNYHAFRCLNCKNLFCDGLTDHDENDENDEAINCSFIHCDFETCRNGYCEACYEQRSPMPGCGTCGVSWCCRDHMTCEC